MHLSGKLNYLVDDESKKQDNNTEWNLEEETYKRSLICLRFLVLF